MCILILAVRLWVEGVAGFRFVWFGGTTGELTRTHTLCKRSNTTPNSRLQFDGAFLGALDTIVM